MAFLTEQKKNKTRGQWVKKQLACKIAMWLTTLGFKNKIMCRLCEDSRVQISTMEGMKGSWMSIVKVDQ